MQTIQAVRGHGSMKSSGPANEAETVIADLFDTMSELMDVIAAENDLLRRGMPAALSDYTVRKATLSDDYTRLCRAVMTEHAQTVVDQPALAQRLVEMGETLRTMSRENMDRLQAALDATRRRIESVMQAIHAHDRESGFYGASGTALAGRFVHGTARYEV